MVENAIRFVDLVDAEIEAGRMPLELRAGELRILTRGSREERRRLIAERHFEWARRAAWDAGAY